MMKGNTVKCSKCGRTFNIDKFSEHVASCGKSNMQNTGNVSETREMPSAKIAYI